MAAGTFSHTVNDYYGSQEGAYTTITQVEINKQTYNVKACIRNMMIKKLGVSGIVQYGSNKTMTFKLSDNLKSIYGIDSIDLICKFSKPNKNEMSIYFSKSDFLPKNKQCPEDVWCIFFKSGDPTPWFDFVNKKRWNYIINPIVGNTIIEPDEVIENDTGKVKPLKYFINVNNLTIKEVEPPKAMSNASRKRRGNIISTKDMQTILRNQKAKGTRGEEIVFRYEKERLQSAGRSDLAKKIKWVGKREDGYGYDIESFEIDPISGAVKNIFIEVKSTSLRNSSAPFYVSENERFVSNQKGDSYYIYRVFGMTNDGPEVHLYIIKGPIENSFKLSANSYLATIISKRR